MADISQKVCTEIGVRQYKQISVNGSVPLGSLRAERDSHAPFRLFWSSAPKKIKRQIIDEKLQELSAHTVRQWVHYSFPYRNH